MTAGELLDKSFGLGEKMTKRRSGPAIGAKHVPDPMGPRVTFLGTLQALFTFHSAVEVGCVV